MVVGDIETTICLESNCRVILFLQKKQSFPSSSDSILEQLSPRHVIEIYEYIPHFKSLVGGQMSLSQNY